MNEQQVREKFAKKLQKLQTWAEKRGVSYSMNFWKISQQTKDGVKLLFLPPEGSE